MSQLITVSELCKCTTNKNYRACNPLFIQLPITTPNETADNPPTR